MLNPFPDLLAFGLLAPTLLRIVIGLVVLLRLKDYRNNLWINKVKKVICIVSSVLLILGALTQYATLALSLVFIYEIFYEPESKDKRTINVLLLTISISLLFLGAGFLAFDLPL